VAQSDDQNDFNDGNDNYMSTQTSAYKSTRVKITVWLARWRCLSHLRNGSKRTTNSGLLILSHHECDYLLQIPSLIQHTQAVRVTTSSWLLFSIDSNQ